MIIFSSFSQEQETDSTIGLREEKTWTETLHQEWEEAKHFALHPEIFAPEEKSPEEHLPKEKHPEEQATHQQDPPPKKNSLRFGQDITETLDTNELVEEKSPPEGDDYLSLESTSEDHLIEDIVEEKQAAPERDPDSKEKD
jgi:hypothetical protein